MIISASRRTDIPAFYSRWFMNRIEAGYCMVRNPFNPRQTQTISLQPDNVDCIVFWTRYARPMFQYFKKLRKREYYFYFLYTLTDYGRELEPHLPPLSRRTEDFKRLSEAIGPDKVIWRYDPIIISKKYTFHVHLSKFEKLCRDMRNFTHRVIVSFVDYYRKTLKNLSSIDDEFFPQFKTNTQFGEFVRNLVNIARTNGLEIKSCAEELDLTPYGLHPGKCIDDQYIRNVFGIEVSSKKDPNQRKYCGCRVSKDIGAYNTCPYGCRYCYATQNYSEALQYLRHHDSTCEWLG